MLCGVIKMQQNQYECVGCHEAITNPVCQDCLSKDIRIWLNKLNPELVPLFNYLTTNYIKVDSNVGCIICGREMQLCPYCFTEDVYYWLKEVAPNLIEDFIVYFNFDLEHQGYSKEP